MHGTDSAIIPDMVQSPLQNHLSLSTSSLDQNDEFLQEMVNQSILKTVDPNLEQRFLSFSMKGEELPKDPPYFDRSFFVKFDVISSHDARSSILNRFKLFEFNLKNDTNSDIRSVHIECGVYLFMKVIPGKIYYEGTIVLFGESNDSDGTFTNEAIATYPVSIDLSDNNSLYNLHSGDEFLKPKYKNSRFYYVLNPQGLLVNVNNFK
jgi:hypothetical protein